MNIYFTLKMIEHGKIAKCHYKFCVPLDSGCDAGGILCWFPKPRLESVEEYERKSPSSKWRKLRMIECEEFERTRAIMDECFSHRIRNAFKREIKRLLEDRKP